MKTFLTNADTNKRTYWGRAMNRWQNRPDGSNWGDFGPDDQIGRLNLITPAVVQKAAAEIIEGLTFCLSLPLDLPGGMAVGESRCPPRMFAPGREGTPVFNLPVGQNSTDVWCDDIVLMNTQYSTQWDALCHLGSYFDADGDGEAEIVYYNGYRGGEDIDATSESKSFDGRELFEGVVARKLGVETMAETCVQSRGIMIDFEKHFGRGPFAVDFDQLQRILDEDGIAVETGDILVLHTGFSDVLLGCGGAPTAEDMQQGYSGLKGMDPRILDWIRDSGVAAIVSDSLGVEAVPDIEKEFESGPMLPIHDLCLFRLGIPLGEMWNLGNLARWLRSNNRYRFMLTAPPLRLPGAVGSPVTPVATV